MRTDDFYMVLPSNSSPDSHPNNTAGDFIVNWENPVDLDPDAKWHVALNELSYIYNPSTVSTNFSIKYNRVVKTEQYRVDQKLYYDPQSKDGIGHQLLKDVEWDFFALDSTNAVYTNSGVDQLDEGRRHSINFDTWIPKLRKDPDNKDKVIFSCKRAFTLAFSSEDRDKLLINCEDTFIHATSRTSDGFWYVPLAHTYGSCIELLKQKPEIQIFGTVHVFSETHDRFNFEKDRDFLLPREFVKYVAENCSMIFEQLTYDETTKRVAMTLRDIVVQVELCGGLHFALGFTKSVLRDSLSEYRKNFLPTRAPTTIYSKGPPQLHRGIMNMFIYASICQPIYVGHTQVPLLKNIFVDSTNDTIEFGHARNTVVYNPMYIPVAATSFNSIEINIRNDAGRIITFPPGAITTITIHFKKM